MVEQLPREFLKDITKLLDKHGSEPFRVLIEYLNDPERISMLKMALIELGTIAQSIEERKDKQKLAKKKKHSSAREFEILLESLHQTEPDKAAILSKLQKGLQSRDLLPTSNGVRNFCHALGLSVQPKAQRKTLISTLLRQLAELPLEKLKIVAEQIATLSLDPGKEYQLLVAAILGSSKS